MHMVCINFRGKKSGFQHMAKSLQVMDANTKVWGPGHVLVIGFKVPYPSLARSNKSLRPTSRGKESCHLLQTQDTVTLEGTLLEDVVFPQGIPGHLSAPQGESGALSRQRTLQALQPDGHGFAPLLQTPATEQQDRVIQHKGASVAVTRFRF